MGVVVLLFLLTLVPGAVDFAAAVVVAGVADVALLCSDKPCLSRADVTSDGRAHMAPSPWKQHSNRLCRQNSTREQTGACRRAQPTLLLRFLGSF